MGTISSLLIVPYMKEDRSPHPPKRLQYLLCLNHGTPVVNLLAALGGELDPFGKAPDFFFAVLKYYNSNIIVI